MTDFDIGIEILILLPEGQFSSRTKARALSRRLLYRRSVPGYFTWDLSQTSGIDTGYSPNTSAFSVNQNSINAV
jgi:hypothetical protein